MLIYLIGIIILFVVVGLLGWLIPLFSKIFSILVDGWGHIFGCIINILLALLFIWIALNLLL